MLMCTYVTYASLRQPLALPASTMTLRTYTAPSALLTWPPYGAAAVGAVGYGVLAAHGAETPAATASTIKLLTALTVLKQKPLSGAAAGPLLTLTQADVDSYNKYASENGSVVKVIVGERLSERQALEALLLPSANNIAETLARWAFGSINAYTIYSTRYAHQLGMTSTTVTDPSGFLGSTTSTPHDLVILGEAALGNAVVAGIAKEPTAVLPVQGVVRNVNVLLGQNGVIGLKTGNNDQDKGCFVVAVDTSIRTAHLTLVGAIMGAPNLAAALHSAPSLMSSVSAGFTPIQIALKGQTLTRSTTPWGYSLNIVAQNDLSVIVWQGTDLQTSLHMRRIYATTPVDSVVGTLQARSNSGMVYAAPVLLKGPVHVPTLLWRLLHPRS